MNISLRDAVSASKRVVDKNAEIPVQVGGGLHPSTAALWAYLMCIQDHFGVLGDLMEIGVFKGWGLFIPGSFCREDERLVLVDISEDNLASATSFVLDHKLVAKHQIQRAQVDSVSPPAKQNLLKCKPLRWVHIDGEHSYAALFSDMSLSASLAGPDAILCVDDVDYKAAPSLNEALYDWLGLNRAWRLLLRGFNRVRP